MADFLPLPEATHRSQGRILLGRLKTTRIHPHTSKTEALGYYCPQECPLPTFQPLSLLAVACLRPETGHRFLRGHRRRKPWGVLGARPVVSVGRLQSLAQRTFRMMRTTVNLQLPPPGDTGTHAATPLPPTLLPHPSLLSSTASALGTEDERWSR